MAHDRRRFLRLSALAAAGALAGCSGTTGSQTDEPGGTEEPDDGETTPTEGPSYTWQAATFDSYWYSLYNMSTNIAMGGNGVRFPHNEEQQEQFEQRFQAIAEHADVDQPPVKNPWLNMAAFTTGDPHFTEKPVLEGPDGRPDASTLRWDRSKSSGVVSPASAAYTHLKGVTWAKNFQEHFDLLPRQMAPKFRAQVLSSLAQIGTVATLVQGGPDGNGALTKDPGENLLLVSGFRPEDGTVVDETPRPRQHAAMLWFLSDLNSLAANGWFGYVNPEPLVPKENIQTLTNGLGRTVMNAFPPSKVVEMGTTRDLGVVLSAIGWFGTQTNDDQLRASAAEYADALAGTVESNLAGNGKLETEANQAAAQGAVAQGLVWASQVEGVDHTGPAGELVDYMLEELWDPDAGTFADGSGSGTYTVTARDAGDVTGGLNAADAELGMDVERTFAAFFDGTFNRGKLQRAERSPSHSDSAANSLPLPSAAGGEHGQAAVYNSEVEYDTAADEWSVTDDLFRTEWALYLANQDIWIGNWGGDFYTGRGVPGKSDRPPE
jgi:hypothetical protein